MTAKIDLTEYTQYGVLAVVAAFLGTFARLPYWLYPNDLKRPDGSPDPRAGRLNLNRAIGELAGVPAAAAIAFTGIFGAMGLYGRALDSPTLLFLIIFAAVLIGLMSMAFIITTIEKGVGPIIDVLVCVVKRIFGSKNGG